MISPNRRWLGGFVLAVALVPSLARAQSMAQSFDELQRILKAEEVVVVIDEVGQESWGRVAQVSASSLILTHLEKTPTGQVTWTAGAQRTFAEANVAEILRSDLIGRKGTRIYLTPARSFQDLRRTLKTGQTVFVSDESGRVRKGKVADMSASSLTVVGSDPLRNGTLIGLAVGAVSGSVVGLRPYIGPLSLAVGGGIGAAIGFLVDRAKGLEGRWTFAGGTVTGIRATDPLLNGALIGAGIGTGLAMWDFLIDPSEPGNAAIFTIAIGLGTAIGAGIDGLVGGKVLYASPRQKAGVTVSPLLGNDRQGVLVSVRF